MAKRLEPLEVKEEFPELVEQLLAIAGKEQQLHESIKALFDEFKRQNE